MSSDKQKINTIFVIEVLGKPVEHLKEALEEIIDKINAEKNVKVVSKSIAEPTELPKNPGMFTSYAEIEIELEDPLALAILVFKYMPAHIDIVSPEHLSLTNKGFNDILNELARRLHGYDHVARVIQAEKEVLEKKVRELSPKK
ncbi:hypothetical protein HOD29_00475 [archaeon]|jgi:hypothetical protein|nr:hypothetical protein [archaeon]